MLMNISGFDHIVLVVRNIDTTLSFYTGVLGLEARQDAAGKHALHFGAQKISLQDAKNPPLLAAGTTPGTGNFCLLTDDPIFEIAETLRQKDVPIVDGPTRKTGAIGPLMSIYIRDPDNNLIEISNPM